MFSSSGSQKTGIHVKKGRVLEPGVERPPAAVWGPLVSGWMSPALNATSHLVKVTKAATTNTICCMGSNRQLAVGEAVGAVGNENVPAGLGSQTVSTAGQAVHNLSSPQPMQAPTNPLNKPSSIALSYDSSPAEPQTVLRERSSNLHEQTGGWLSSNTYNQSEAGETAAGAKWKGEAARGRYAGAMTEEDTLAEQENRIPRERTRFQPLTARELRRQALEWDESFVKETGRNVRTGPAQSAKQVDQSKGLDAMREAVAALDLNAGCDKVGSSEERATEGPTFGWERSPLATVRLTAQAGVQGDVGVMKVAWDWALAVLRTLGDGALKGADGLDRETICALTDVCAYALRVPLQQRLRIYRSLISAGLLAAVAAALTADDAKLWEAATCMLTWTLVRDPPSLRAHLPAVRRLLHRFPIVEATLAVGEGRLQTRLAKLMHGLLSLTNTVNTAWLDPLLDDVIQQVVALIAADVSAASGGAFDEQSDEAEMRKLKYACNMLTNCVRHYGASLGPILLRHRAPEAIACLVACRPQDFAAAGARFLRMCLERRDPGYVPRLVRGDLFAPVLAAYPANAGAGNPIAVEVLALVNFVVEENITDVVRYLWEQFGHFYYMVRHVPTFSKLRIKYEEIMTTY
ncbi:hypothetical protein KFL_002770060 [Klebsormidium nitens]|uniref:Serine/threonine-protein phosphatase 4 regulatory subunit 3-like central domain-containing protein n=1 Tax=Klebsormidium nitens TaxID=105231 RepID=A0A1Y1I9X4_KLENI|nr:hypothetical protein KFL_002770060 [Klebsormidium nitens]|eukprot:GAQ86229.1 hypothetical protein KFL_002770060 [Klebsormidium nitens]